MNPAPPPERTPHVFSPNAKASAHTNGAIAKPLLSNGALDVQRIGQDRVRIRTADAGEPAAEALIAWLGRQREVVKVRYHMGTGAIDVRYKEEPRAGGRFLRSLRDRVFMIERPEAPAGFHVELAHSLEGRARFRLTSAPEDAFLRLAAWIQALPGVTRANGSPASDTILVLFDPAITNANALLDAIVRSRAAEWPEVKPEPRRHEWRKTTLNTVVLAATMSGVVPVPAISAAVALTALPSARRAFRAMGEQRLSVDLLDLAAIGISIGTGQPATAAFITWLLGVGDLVLERTNDTARGAISKLMKLDASDAWRIRGDDVEKVPVKRLSVGDRVVVEPGGRVPADGVVVGGVASVDEKALTGESIPHDKKLGDRVLAATVVVEGQIVVEIDRVGTDTTAAKIVQILEGAGAKPMTLQRDTERFADKLVLPTFALAGGAAFFASQIDRMTSVLITDFGTGIRIAVPASALTAMTVAAREGVLVKGGQYLERLAKTDVIVFDKTGTLTGGAPEVFEVIAFGGRTAHEAIAFAAAAEERQHHPVAEAIRAYAARAGLHLPEPELGSEKYTIGVGLRARVDGRDVLVGGKRLMLAHGVRIAHAGEGCERHRMAGASSIFVAIDGKLEALVGYADEPRRESAEVVRALRANGRREVILMSGDARGPVEAVGRAVCVDRTLAELLPEDKARHIRELQRAGKIVAMIGDGINDAPALAVADVGISLHGGTDVALETADVVLLDGGLVKLPQAFAIADQAMAHVKRGLAMVVVPNAAAIVLGALGLMTPGLAAVINNGSTVIAALASVSPLLRRAPKLTLPK